MIGWPWPQPAHVAATSSDLCAVTVADSPPEMLERGSPAKCVLMVTPMGDGLVKSYMAVDAARALARDLMRKANEAEGKT